MIIYVYYTCPSWVAHILYTSICTTRNYTLVYTRPGNDCACNRTCDM